MSTDRDNVSSLMSIDLDQICKFQFSELGAWETDRSRHFFIKNNPEFVDIITLKLIGIDLFRQSRIHGIHVDMKPFRIFTIDLVSVSPQFVTLSLEIFRLSTIL